MIDFFSSNADRFIDGTIVTVRLALLAFAIAVVMGVIIASFRVSPVPPLQRFAAAYVSLFRNLPLLVIFFLALFGLGDLGLVYDGFPTAVVALGMYTGAYMAEVIRSGINSVSSGQAEAGRAIGLGFVPLLVTIVVPQAVRTVIAPIGNLFIANFKNTAVALTITVTDLTFVSRQLINQTAEVLYSVGGAAIIYTVILLGAGWGFRSLESRYAIKR